MAHTPGPWRAFQTPGRWNVHHKSDGFDGGVFAEVRALHTTELAQQIARDNAALIAAAPDLLAAVEALLAADDLDPRTWPTLCAASIATADAFALARAAIAKAEGISK